MQNNLTDRPRHVITGGLRLFLYATAALNGAAILVIEILGAKMLAPYIGTSHFVWTAQISVTLLSLAIGYFIGGRWSDRSQGIGGLYAAMAGAAVYLALTLRMTEAVSYRCLDLGVKLGSIMAAAFLFFVPLTLLAMTGPFLLRFLARSMEGVGGQAGLLSAVSTVGSVAGAALIGYVLIPLLPNSATLLATSGVLVLLSAIYFTCFGKSMGKAATALVVAAGAAMAGIQGVRADLRADYGRGEELVRLNSFFGILQVIRIRGSEEYFYVNDYLTQNVYYRDTKQSGATFTYMLHGLARGYTPELKSALCIGLGVGIVPALLSKEGVKCDVIEINEASVPLAQKYFDLDTSQFQLHIADGRHFLNKATSKYDTVILDAFLGDSSPSHLMTREAFVAMKKCLNPQGTVVLNCFGHLQSGRDFFVASLERTLKAVFKNVRIHDSGRGNVFMAASDQESFVLRMPQSFDDVHASVQSDVRRSYVNIVSTDPSRGQVLTDDDNPVEFHDAKNREEFRRNMAFGMRRRQQPNG